MSARILVVDDVEMNVRLLEAKLSAEYFNVLTAHGGSQALKLAQDERPDVILLDVMMPRMDGFEVCRLLKADAATMDIPVVMVTALSDAADRVRGLEAGADDFLTKPVNDTALFARVRSLVRLRRTIEEWRHREDVYGQLSSPTTGAAALVSEAAPQIVLWEEAAAAAARLQDMLAPLKPSILRPPVPEDVTALCGPAIDLAILNTTGRVDALRIVGKLRAREESRLVPILLIGDADELARVAKGLDLGATDYLLRPLDRNELLARVKTQVRRKRMQDRLQDNYQKSLSLALTDPLTGLYNRRYLDVHLEGLMARVAQGAPGPALLLIDVDFFKRVNDTLGHDAGDQVLREVTARMARHVRPFDLCARYGGEEFVILLPDTDRRNAEMVAERLRMVVAEQSIRLDESGREVAVTVSIGLAATQGASETAATLLRRADEALYAAKQGGRNRVVSLPAEDRAVGAVA